MSPETEIPTKGPKPRISILLATWFGLGYLPKAPGTWGSLAGTALALVMAHSNWIALQRNTKLAGMYEGKNFWTVGLPTYPREVVVTLLISIIGVIVATRASRYAQIEDPQWVVIDEVSGQLITYFLFFLIPHNWKSWLLGFILFRLFDIWKPFPARQLESLPGGWGIMADDWMAGIYAAIVLRVALHFRVL
jgi:phosphatidylglycerophosphatase A